MVKAYTQYPEKWRATPRRLAWTAIVVSFAFYLDTKYFSLMQSELTQFQEKSRLYGDWRARNARKPASKAVDHEVLQQ